MSEVIQADLMSTDYVTLGGKPIIYWFLRDIDGNRITKVIKDFKPHAWTAEPAFGGARKVYDLFDQPMYEWTTRLPSEIGGGRSRFSSTSEADILFPLRALIDYGIYCGVEIRDGVFSPVEHHSVDPVVGLFDFEFISPKEIFAMPDDPRWPMVANQWGLTSDDIIRVNMFNIRRFDQAPEGMITQEMIDGADERERLWSSITEITVTLLDGTTRTYPVEVTVCDDERDMFINFAKASNDHDPDVWSGYNSNNYDWPMLFERGKRLRITPHIKRNVSPLNSAWCRFNERMKKWDLIVKGRNLIDLCDVYKKYVKPTGERTSYDLKIVVKDECGFVYEDWGDRMLWGYLNDPLGLLDYCIKDVIALKLLNEECELVSYIDVLRRVAGSLWERSLSNKNLVDTVCLRLSDRPLPTGFKGQKTKKAKGALVIKPPPGLHEWVILLDLKSIYPTVMIAYNLSPECKLLPGEEYPEEHTSFVPIVDDAGNVLRTVRYKNDVPGIISKACEHLMSLREHYRGIKNQLEADGLKDTKHHKMIKSQETVAKFLACSINGVMAYPGFRLYDPEVFECVTSITRMMIWKIIEVLKPLGYDIIYGDTDSVFVRLKAQDKEAALAECPEVEQIVQDYVYEWCQSIGATYPIEIKLEHLFDAIIFKKKAKSDDPAKKRYGAHYILKDWLPIDGFKIQGLEPKSSAAAMLTRNLMTEWLHLVLGEKDISKANNLVLAEFKKDWSKEDMTQIGIPRGLKQRPFENYMGGGLQPWAIGCLGAMEFFEKKFNEDDKPKLIYTIPTSKYPRTAICITEETELWPGVRVDWKKQKEKILKDKFRELLAAVGINWIDFMSGLKQSSMDAFF